MSIDAKGMIRPGSGGIERIAHHAGEAANVGFNLAGIGGERVEGGFLDFLGEFEIAARFDARGDDEEDRGQDEIANADERRRPYPAQLGLKLEIDGKIEHGEAEYADECGHRHEARARGEMVQLDLGDDGLGAEQNAQVADDLVGVHGLAPHHAANQDPEKKGRADRRERMPRHQFLGLFAGLAEAGFKFVQAASRPLRAAAPSASAAAASAWAALVQLGLKIAKLGFDGSFLCHRELPRTRSSLMRIGGL